MKESTQSCAPLFTTRDVSLHEMFLAYYFTLHTDIVVVSFSP